MIILYDYKLCLLEKPKCGSRSLVKSLSPPINLRWDKGSTFFSKKNLHDVKFDYYHSHYIHVNLLGAITHLKKIKHNINDYTFISILRNPIDLINSWYCFDIRRQKGRWHNKYFSFQNLQEMINCPHYQQFKDNVFLAGKDDVNLVLFDLYKIENFVNFLYTNYNIAIKFPMINVNKNKQPIVNISRYQQQVEKDFPLFYKINE